MAWLPWQREEHFLIFQLFMTCYSGNQAPNGEDLTRDTLFSLIWRVFKGQNHYGIDLEAVLVEFDGSYYITGDERG